MIDRTIVVTGGAGFIGSHLVDRLLALDYKVAVLDNFSTGKISNLKSAQNYGDRLRISQCDITGAGLDEVMAELSPLVVFHLAAQADVRRSIADPVHDALVNVIGSVNVVEAARKSGAERIIYAASGGTLYGEPSSDLLPLTEEVDHEPLSFYGVSKKAAIDYLRAQASLYGTDFLALALANVYGPRQDPHGESGVVSIFASNLINGSPCVIFGDGRQTRDFVYVGDVVEAFVKAIDSPAGEVVNISTASETSIEVLYYLIASITGSVARTSFAPGRTGEIMRSSLANQKALKLLGWKPETDLSSGLSRVIAWLAHS